MANKPVAFQAGSNMVIKIYQGTTYMTLAYAQSLSFSDRMAVAPVGGIGSYSYDALEPLQYSASGSMVITQYSKAAYAAITAIGTPAVKPERAGTTVTTNTMMRSKWYSPLLLMASTTFDIDVYDRKQSAVVGHEGEPTEGDLIYTLGDCRLNSYSMTFTPGSLVQENVGFICLTVTDVKYEIQA